MTIGIVKWFDLEKGLGSIRPQDGSEEILVHIDAVEDAGLFALIEGEEVDYDPVRNSGLVPRAEDLEIVKE